MTDAAGRYTLYISYACPWANRCLAVLKLKVRFQANKCVVGWMFGGCLYMHWKNRLLFIEAVTNVM